MAAAAGYGFMNNIGNSFNTYKAMERHMDGGNGYRDSVATRPCAAAGGESFYGGGLSNETEQDLFEKVRIQMTQMGRRRNWGGVKATNNGKSIHQGNGEHEHKGNNGVQTGRYNNLYGGGAQGGAQRPRFGALAADASTSRHRE